MRKFVIFLSRKIANRLHAKEINFFIFFANSKIVQACLVLSEHCVSCISLRLRSGQAKEAYLVVCGLRFFALLRLRSAPTGPRCIGISLCSRFRVAQPRQVGISLRSTENEADYQENRAWHRYAICIFYSLTLDVAPKDEPLNTARNSLSPSRGMRGQALAFYADFIIIVVWRNELVYKQKLYALRLWILAAFINYVWMQKDKERYHGYWGSNNIFYKEYPTKLARKGNLLTVQSGSCRIIEDGVKVKGAFG